MSRSRSILHLDRDREFHAVVRDALAEHGYEATFVPDPFALVKELKSRRHRVVLLDPAAFGAEDVRLLREIKSYDAGILVIMTVDRSSVTAIVDALSGGAEACLLRSADNLPAILDALHDAFRKFDRWWASMIEFIRASRDGSPAADVPPAPHCPVVTSPDDRRGWQRYGWQGTRIGLISGGEVRQVEIVDVSFGGIAVKAEMEITVAPGEIVSLWYDGVALRGTVCNVRVQPDGQRLLGIEWVSAPRKSPAPAPVADDQALFLPLNGIRVCCKVTRNLGGGSILVELPDGFPRELRQQACFPMTRVERRRELDSMGDALSVLLGMYQLGTFAGKDAAVRAILRHEFPSPTHSVPQATDAAIARGTPALTR